LDGKLTYHYKSAHWCTSICQQPYLIHSHIVWSQIFVTGPEIKLTPLDWLITAHTTLGIRLILTIFVLFEKNHIYVYKKRQIKKYVLHLCRFFFIFLKKITVWLAGSHYLLFALIASHSIPHTYTVAPNGITVPV